MRKQDKKETAEISAAADQWYKQAVSRSNCYGLLALVFRDTPTSEIVSQLRTPLLADILVRLGYDIVQNLAGELEPVTKRLCEQYTQVFVGPGPHVSPYASAHHDHEGRLWGDSTVWVKRFIETTGLSFRNNWGSIPDHIAIELELMQRLTAHEAQLWLSGLSDPSHNNKNLDKQLCQCLHVQEQFLCDHLCVWIPQFCGRVLEASTSIFYTEMVKLTKSVVISDAEQIKAAESALQSGSFAGRIQQNAPLQ
ncbi:MAG: TorD/DmsD family molecular chaperone [Planctomycetota bacterium]|jgi:TorA maturation chaperone TorD